MLLTKKIILQILEIVSKSIFLQKCRKEYTTLIATGFDWFVG